MASIAVDVSSLPALYSFTANASTPAVTYTIPPRLFTAPVQLTLNLCNAPEAYNQSSTSTFTAYTNATYTYGKAIRGGFANLTIPVTEDPEALTVLLDAGEAPQDYTFELGISIKPDTPWHILDRLPLFAFEDSDNTTALFTSPTYFSAESETPPAYDPITVPNNDVRTDLIQSSCYVRSLRGAGSVSTTTTTRGTVELTVEEGGWEGEAQQGARKVQYTVSDLQTATNYSLWGVAATEEGGSRLYQQQYFTTKRDDRCRLAVDIPFCPDIAYSIPAPPSMSMDDLLDLYRSTISPIMDNFNTTLSTFPCEGDLRKLQGMYSPVRTCSQCLSAYRSWLCSIRMPRCTDYDDSSSNETDNDNIRTFPRLSANTSRTPRLPEDAFPYSEIPPCIDVCAIVRASCPPLIANTFQCPLKEITLEQSYGTPFVEQISFENVQGGDDPSYIQTALDDDEDNLATRAKDRYGNVQCNDMGVLNLVERRRWSGMTRRAIVSGANRSTSINFVAMSVLATCISLTILILL